MTQWVSLSRAARLIGVARGVLQRQIREGQLATADGLVSMASLAELYPQWNAEDSGAFEHVMRVREQAFGRRVLERMLPSQAVLAQRMFAQSQELADVRRHLQRYHALVMQIQQRLDTADAARSSPQLRALSVALEQGLAEILGSEPADAITVMDDILKIVSAHV